MKRLILVAVLSGCGTTGVVPIGQDTYMVSSQSATGFTSGGQVAAELYKEAGAHCASQNKQLQPVNIRSVDGVPYRSMASAELQFRCLSKDDPELRRPTLSHTPNVRIENVTK